MADVIWICPVSSRLQFCVIAVAISHVDFFAALAIAGRQIKKAARISWRPFERCYLEMI